MHDFTDLHPTYQVFFLLNGKYFQKKLNFKEFLLDEPKRKRRIRPRNRKKRKENKTMIKAIAITLTLGALTATANTLPPTPEAPMTVQH